MRSALWVAARELRAHAPVAWAAVAAAALPWVAAWLPIFGHHSPSDVRVVTSLVVAALLAAALPLLVGAALVGRDVGGERLAFYLALPLRAAELWGGKLLAGAVLVYGALALALLPVLLAGGDAGLATLVEQQAVRDPVAAVLLAVGGPFLLLLGAHQLAVALRARSAWLALEVASLALATAVSVAALGALGRAGAGGERHLAMIASTLAVGLVFVGAGWAALAHGRAMAVRLHRAQALVVAAGLLVLALTLVGFAHWVLSPERDDVVAFERLLPGRPNRFQPR